MTLVATSAKASGASGRVVLFDSTLGADAASIDTGANGIEPGHNILTVYVYGRTTQVAVSSSISVRLNNDSGANYDQGFVGWVTGAVSGGGSVAQTSWLLAFPGASMDAGSAGVVTFAIPSYDQTTLQKQTADLEALGSGTVNNNAIVSRSLRWRSATAISRLSVTAGSGNLLAGTRLLILGG